MKEIWFFRDVQQSKDGTTYACITEITRTWWGKRAEESVVYRPAGHREWRDLDNGQIVPGVDEHYSAFVARVIWKELNKVS